ncbi:MAG: DUF4129 domain-containing protein [Spirochaetaceae bacterium]|nr:DUF4129 domain-containing protein [Spirochaetaceae bacterium]
MKESRKLIAKSLAERVLILFLVTTVTTTFSLLIVDFIRRFEYFTFYSWILCVYLFFTGIATQCVSWIFFKEKTTIFANVRFIVFYELLFSTLFTFVIPGVPSLLIVIPTLFEYYFTIKLEKAFSYHDAFVKSCGDLSGQPLASMLHEESWLISDFVETIDDSIFKLAIFSLVTTVFFLALFFTNTKLSAITVIFMLIHAVLFVFTRILSSIFKNETYYAGMGLSSIFPVRRRLLKVSFFFCLICVVIAFFIASNTALLKPSYFAWLFAWLRGTKSEGNTQTITTTPEMRPTVLEEMSLQSVGGEVNPFFELLFQIIKWIALVGMAGLILFFFFGPFFSAKWRDFWKNKKLITYMRRLRDLLKSALKSLFSMRIKRGEAYMKAATDFKEKISTILEASKKSKEKKKEIDRLTTQFLKLIEWGEERDIAYKKNLAPAEYTSLISERYPALGAQCDTAGTLFEKALYAKELLTPDEEKRFVEAVSAVVKSTAQ